MLSQVETSTIIWTIAIMIGFSSGAYGFAWTINNNLNNHKNDSGKHVESDKFIYRDICDERVKRIEQAIQTVTKEISKDKKDRDEQIKELKKLIQDNGKR